MADLVTVFVRPGDPTCERALAYLRARDVEIQVIDITTDPQATQLLMSRVGQVVVPTFVVGDKLLVGFDPVQLARYLPRSEEDVPGVNFGAAVRSVTADIAKQRGLPYPYGVEVGAVREGSPAELAGIASGDLITEIGAYTLTGGAEQFRTAVNGRRAGDTMTLTLIRDADPWTVEVQFPEPEPVASGDGAEPGAASIDT